jgi:hypothetical protein
MMNWKPCSARPRTLARNPAFPPRSLRPCIHLTESRVILCCVRSTSSTELTRTSRLSHSCGKQGTAVVSSDPDVAVHLRVDAMNFRIIWMGPEDDPQPGPSRQGGPSSDFLNGMLPRYARQGTGMVRQERLRNGPLKVTTLANFQARIVSDLVFDDGEQEKREFGIEAKLEETSLAFSVSAEEFGRMGWVLSKLGPEAILYPGQHQHARAAIQSFSGPIRQERIYTHLGWRKHGPDWIYVHAGGALGPSGQLSTVGVRLPARLCRLIKSRNRRILRKAYEQSVTACAFFRSPRSGLPFHFWLAYTELCLESWGLVSFS